MATNLPRSDNRPTSVDWESALTIHHRWLRTVILARAGDAQAVDEIMQEVAVAAVRQSAPLKDHSKVAPWLYRLAVRQALLYRRRLGRQRRLQSRFEKCFSGSCDQSNGDPLVWLLQNELRQVMRTAIEKLNRKDAEILMLKYSEDWSYRQLAEHLGISTNAVESRLHRARKRLRGELAALNFIEVYS